MASLTPPVSRPVVLYAVQTLDAVLAELTATSGTAVSHDEAVERVAVARRELAGELWGGCRHLLVPVDPDDPDENAPYRCERCNEVYDVRDIDAGTLERCRAASRAEDEFTKREAEVF